MYTEVGKSDSFWWACAYTPQLVLHKFFYVDTSSSSMKPHSRLVIVSIIFLAISERWPAKLIML